MVLFSLLKSGLLKAADGFNAAVGGPQPFTRAAVPDPAGTFPSDEARRDAIAAAAEAELANFVSDGVFFAMKPNDLGDTAIWQGVYTAMTAIRWSANKSPANQSAMLAAAKALSRYFYPTAAGSAMLVRGAVPAALEGAFFRVDPNHSSDYFTDSYLGPVYAYRDDASLDSLLGVMFGAAMVKRFGDAPSIDVLAGPLSTFCSGFEAAGRRLAKRDGSPTTYGDCRPGFFQAPVRTLAGLLPSLLCGCLNWRKTAEQYAPEFATTDTQVPGNISYVNAHLAMLATLAFTAAAPTDAPGLDEAKSGLRALVDKYADTGNAFLVYAAAQLGAWPTPAQRAKADKTLLEFPLRAKPKAGLNSSVAPALQPVPVWQRPPFDVAWQRSPYPYSGSDPADYSRLDYLLANYLQRST